MDKQNIIVIGKIIATHGIKGWVTIQSYSYPKEKIINYKTFIILNNSIKMIKIIDLKIMPKKVIIQIEDYVNIEQSQLLIGRNILIDNKDMPLLNKNEHYWKDLIGLDVFTSKDKYLGKVDFIFNNGANDVLALKNMGQSSYIALINEYIDIIPNEKIIVNDEYI